jgi:hypothetical protein
MLARELAAKVPGAAEARVATPAPPAHDLS